MRFAIAAVLLLAAGVPATEAKSTRMICSDRCNVQYHFCLNRTTTKHGRDLCKIDGEMDTALGEVDHLIRLDIPDGLRKHRLRVEPVRPESRFLSR